MDPEQLERAGRRGHHTLAAATVGDGPPEFTAWSLGDPLADPRLRFEIGSITKVFTGVLLADIHLRGEVSLGGPLLALAQRPVFELNRRMSVGLGSLILTRRGKDPLVWHNGGTWGFRSFVGFCAPRGRGAVVLANTARSVDGLGFEILDARPG